MKHSLLEILKEEPVATMQLPGSYKGIRFGKDVFLENNVLSCGLRIVRQLDAEGKEIAEQYEMDSTGTRIRVPDIVHNADLGDGFTLRRFFSNPQLNSYTSIIEYAENGTTINCSIDNTAMVDVQITHTVGNETYRVSFGEGRYAEKGVTFSREVSFDKHMPQKSRIAVTYDTLGEFWKISTNARGHGRAPNMFGVESIHTIIQGKAKQEFRRGDRECKPLFAAVMGVHNAEHIYQRISPLKSLKAAVRMYSNTAIVNLPTQVMEYLQ